MHTNTITVTAAEGTWVVRTGGAVIGESDAALRVEEDGYPFVIYFPRADIEMAFLEPSADAPFATPMGEAVRYSIVAKSGVLENMAWSVETPAEGFSRIKDYLAFNVGEKLAVERL